MQLILILILAILASLGGFIIHVITIEWLPDWIGAQMSGVEIQPSWHVKYLAGATSIEYGLAAIGLYYLARERLNNYGTIKSAFIFSVLLMALHGAFIRQPIMDFAIGNPMHVVLVQNAFKCVPWVMMAFVTVYGYELIHNIFKTKDKPLETQKQ